SARPLEGETADLIFAQNLQREGRQVDLTLDIPEILFAAFPLHVGEPFGIRLGRVFKRVLECRRSFLHLQTIDTIYFAQRGPFGSDLNDQKIRRRPALRSLEDTWRVAVVHPNTVLEVVLRADQVAQVRLVLCDIVAGATENGLEVDAALLGEQ